MAPKITDEDRKYELELSQQVSDSYDKLIKGLKELFKQLTGEEYDDKIRSPRNEV